MPKHAWHTPATGILHWTGTEYLLIADYSTFPIIRKLTNISSSAIINHLKVIFDEHGIPERLISDNGPQYSSEEFQVFSARHGFDHVTSSLLYHGSNGFTERTVQTVKQVFHKGEGRRGRPSLGDVVSQDNPIDHNLPTQCELLNERTYKSNLPAVSSRSNGDVNAFLQQRQDVYKSYHNRTAKELAPLSPHHTVRVLKGHIWKTWDLAKVTNKASTPRSYNKWIWREKGFGGKIWTGSLDKLSAQFPNIARLRRRDKYYFWHLYHS